MTLQRSLSLSPTSHHEFQEPLKNTWRVVRDGHKAWFTNHEPSNFLLRLRFVARFVLIPNCNGFLITQGTCTELMECTVLVLKCNVNMPDTSNILWGCFLYCVLLEYASVSANAFVQISGATETSLWLSRGMLYQTQASYLLWQEQDMYLFHFQMLTKQQKAIKLLCWTLSNIFLYLYIINFITFVSCPLQFKGTILDFFRFSWKGRKRVLWACF